MELLLLVGHLRPSFVLSLFFAIFYRPLVDPQLQDLISRLLAKIPEERIKMQEIKVFCFCL